jgi:hypothetical protein
MSYRIICADALEWMLQDENMGNCGAVITSPPDMHEIPGVSFDEWHKLFTQAVFRSVRIHTPGCPVIFYVTDRKHQGNLISKANIIMRVMQYTNMKLLWHKIALRRGVGKIDFMRPTYSHLIAFGNGIGPGAATADVIERGRTLYPNGTGMGAAQVAVEFARKYTDTITDPFCGVGTIVAVAKMMGVKNTTGVDIDQLQCDKAIINLSQGNLIL